jgi:hypothetical protein
LKKAWQKILFADLSCGWDFFIGAPPSAAGKLTAKRRQRDNRQAALRGYWLFYAADPLQSAEKYATLITNLLMRNGDK